MKDNLEKYDELAVLCQQLKKLHAKLDKQIAALPAPMRTPDVDTQLSAAKVQATIALTTAQMVETVAKQKREALFEQAKKQKQNYVKLPTSADMPPAVVEIGRRVNELANELEAIIAHLRDAGIAY